ncbi:hypothetical protein ACWEFL_01890 [Streptomyces sp. NPDC004838]
MAADPTDPDIFADEQTQDDRIEDDQDYQAADDRAAGLDQEVPEADAAEQHTEVRPERDDPLSHINPDTANEADAVEQARVVALDEDDYR